MVCVFKGTEEEFRELSKKATITPEQLAECKAMAKRIPHADSLSYKLKQFIKAKMAEPNSNSLSAHDAFNSVLKEIERIENL